ncbi:uncharacterized protein LOC132265890 [Phlebotomus argentipes]|uniref:uncharacterized protein LOC132265890 n=1 Tax=Phlebotomus argentipes TaxID=94469 RepID=UPI002892DDE3|nr:uncharacterized protein LOC132265890 [Phlebotomus argentipes]
MENLHNYYNANKYQIQGRNTSVIHPQQRLMKIPGKPEKITEQHSTVPRSFYSDMTINPSTSKDCGQQQMCGIKRQFPERISEEKKLLKTNNKLPMKRWKVTVRETGERRYQEPKRAAMPSMQIITGSIAQITAISKQMQEQNFTYEFYAKVVCIKDGKYACEKLILLRNESGPFLQAIFYAVDHKLPANVQEGQIVRCVGRFNHKSRFVIFKISPTNAQFVDVTSRLHALCHFTINKDKKN